MIKLKVCEKTFVISESNLRKSGYFNSYLERWNNQELELDEDPRIFGHVLNCLRYDNYQIPLKYKNNVLSRLEYYGINSQEEFTWVTKTAVFNDVDISFNFTGKLAGIVFCDQTIYGLSIVVNEIIIFNDYTYPCFIKQCSHTNNSDYMFNNRFLKNLEELEGDFDITITNNSEQSITIIYFEKMYVSASM